MSTGLHSWSQTAGTNATADSTISWPEGMAPGAVNDSARAMMAIMAKYRDDTAGTITTAGTSTAYTATPSTTFASFAELNGQVLYLKMHATSGATPTLNVGALGAKNIKSVSGTNIATGYLLEGGIYAFTYSSGNNEFVVHGVPGAIGTLSSLTVTGAVSTGALSASGNFAINTDKFTVAAASGNTVVAGTLGVTGDVAVNTNKFTIAAASGNTVIAGTAAIAGDVAVATNKFTVAAASGNTAVAGTLAVTGATAMTGALTANNSAGIVGRNTLKAFGRVINGTLQAGSFNVDNIADNGATHTVTFTNPMANALYAIVLGSDSDNIANATQVNWYSTVAEGSFRIGAIVPSVGAVDPDSYSFMVLSNE